MLSEFMFLISSPEFDEDGLLSVRTVERGDRELQLTVAIEGSDVPRQTWRITCRGVCAARFGGLEAGVDLLDDHPLLWPYVEDEVELYFRGEPACPHQVLGALVESLAESVGNWFAIHDFINRSGRPAARQLASG